MLPVDKRALLPALLLLLASLLVIQWYSTQKCPHVSDSSYNLMDDDCNERESFKEQEAAKTEEVVEGSCRRNTSSLIRQMRETQRQMNSLLKNNIPDVDKRWDAFHPFLDAAMSGWRHELQPFELWSGDEFKYFLNFSDPRSECLYVTLGVGQNWEAEKLLRRKYPQCEFVAVDPIEDGNRKLVESGPNSRFVHAAVGNAKGDQEASVYVNATYVGLNVPHRAFSELLATETKSSLIDFLTIDVEGAEFALLKEFLLPKRAELPVICQFNVEIHTAPIRYNVKWEEVLRTVNKIIDEGHFILLHTMKGLWSRTSFLNVGDDACVQKLLC